LLVGQKTNLNRIYAYHNIEKNNGAINLIEWNFYHLYQNFQTYFINIPKIVNLALLFLGQAHEGNFRNLSLELAIKQGVARF
jgi:hypothetical protein